MRRLRKRKPTEVTLVLPPTYPYGEMVVVEANRDLAGWCEGWADRPTRWACPRGAEMEVDPDTARQWETAGHARVVARGVVTRDGWQERP